MSIASVLAVIGGIVTLLCAVERVTAAISHAIRSCIPIVVAIRELVESVRTELKVAETRARASSPLGAQKDVSGDQ
jgi:hypothetical protein